MKEKKKKRRKGRKSERKNEARAYTQFVPGGGSDFAHCHCNFLTGCSFRGVPHHRGITYRWLFVRMSPRVIICLVTRSVTAYLASLSISPPSRLSLSLPLSMMSSLSASRPFSGSFPRLVSFPETGEMSEIFNLTSR